MRSFDSFINDNAWQSLPYPPPAGLCRVICDLNSFSYLSLASSNNTLLLLLLVLLLPESSCCTSVVVSAGTSLSSCQVARRQSIVCSTSVSSSPSSSSSSTSSTASSRNYYLCLHAIFVGLGQIGGTPETWHVHGMKATRSMATF